MQTEHFIDGREVPSVDGRTFRSVNPATGQVLADVAFGAAGDVDRAVRAAWDAFGDGRWAALGPDRRAMHLRRLAAAIRDRSSEIATLESQDTGKPVAAARLDVESAADLLDYVATIPQNLRGNVFPDDPGYLTYSRRSPYGVVAAIAPWNFPFLLAVWKTAFALAVGNSVVLKMAEQTPLTTSLLARLTVEAGIPRGVFNVVHGGASTGAALAAHPGTPKITFTGSTEVGRSILASAALLNKSVHLELGGKSPNVVFADADLDRALDAALFTSFFNSGQVCTAGTRLLVEESIGEEFTTRLAARAERLRMGDPLSADTELGPVVSAEQFDRISTYIRSGVDSGASIRTGGIPPQRREGHGLFIRPVIFANVDSHAPIAQEEIFGPVLSVFQFSTPDEAVSLANSVSYGLSASIWTKNIDRALKLSEKIDAGIIWTNCVHHVSWQAPYEGHKASGLGEDLGIDAARTFTRLKVNHINFGASSSKWPTQ